MEILRIIATSWPIVAIVVALGACMTIRYAVRRAFNIREAEIEDSRAARAVVLRRNSDKYSDEG